MINNKQSVLSELDGYELFRLAIVERNADAWAECIARYRPLLMSWANSSSSAWLNEPCCDIADQAFVRAWSALKPERFADFPTLSSLLAYLRSCVSAVVVDCVRSQKARQRMIQRLESTPVPTPEHTVIEQSENEELWRVAEGAAKNPQERTVLLELFVLDMPPRKIHERHPELFTDVEGVYKCKRNLLGRLQRHPDIQRLYRDHMPA